MNQNNHKNVTSKRATFTKSEREYVKGIVHNLSFQRLTDQEIVQWLHDEKKINVDRSTISKIRHKVEQQAENWYNELRDTSYKYIALYKERIDSLMSYQKRLHEIVERYSADHIYPDTVIKAISELHRIEMSIFSLWKELPRLGTSVESTSSNSRSGVKDSQYFSLGVFVNDCHCHEIITHCKCKYCLTTWCPADKEKKPEWCPNPECSHGIKGHHFRPADDEFTWVQCPDCERYFRTPEVLALHNCSKSP